MIVFPNCKINLGLYITSRRDDGYHNLKTVFYPIKGLKDALEIVPGTGQMHLSGLGIAGDAQNNLVLKAWHLLHEQYAHKMPPSDIYLHKAIPMGAGMGGGSADGAFALKLFNDYFNLGIGQQKLAEMALQLGSDCPFFIYNNPQFASGRGECLSPSEIDLSQYSIQIVCPGIHVNTGAAFKMISPRPAPYDLRQLDTLPISKWASNISNDFEIPVFAQHPILASIKEKLYQDGALYAAMSGSGSTIFGIFEKGKRSNVADSYYFE